MRTIGFLAAAWMITVLVAGVATAVHAQSTDGKAEVVTLKVSGMTCGGCEAAVKMAARKVDGVKAVQASSERGTAQVTYDPSRTNPEAIANAITRHSGFRAEAPKSAKK
jgi:copper chaperone